MFSTAVALSILTVGACIIIYIKLPRQVRRFLEKHSLMTDLICLIGTYYFLGGTITALLAAGIVGLMVSGLLEVANNKDQYLYLYDLRDFIRGKLTSTREALNQYGDNYKQKKAALQAYNPQE